jgi:WD40 repeat protein
MDLPPLLALNREISDQGRNVLMAAFSISNNNIIPSTTTTDTTTTTTITNDTIFTTTTSSLTTTRKSSLTTLVIITPNDLIQNGLSEYDAIQYANSLNTQPLSIMKQWQDTDLIHVLPPNTNKLHRMAILKTIQDKNIGPPKTTTSTAKKTTHAPTFMRVDTPSLILQRQNNKLSSSYFSICFDETENYLFAGGEKEILIWDIQRGEQVVKAGQGVHTAYVWSLAASPVGHLLASGGADYKVVFWNSQPPFENRFQITHYEHVFALAFSQNGSRLVVGGGQGSMTLWSIDVITATATKIFTHNINVTIRNICFLAPDRFFTATEGLALWKIQPITTTTTTTTSTNATINITQTTITPITWVNSSGNILKNPGAAPYLDYREGNHYGHYTASKHGVVRCVIVDHLHQGLIYSCGDDGAITAWVEDQNNNETTTPTLLLATQARSAHSGTRVHRVCLAGEDNEILVSVGEDKYLRFWDSDHLEELRSIHIGVSSIALALGPTGTALASSSNDKDGSIRVWHSA